MGIWDPKSMYTEQDSKRFWFLSDLPVLSSGGGEAQAGAKASQELVGLNPRFDTDGWIHLSTRKPQTQKPCRNTNQCATCVLPNTVICTSTAVSSTRSNIEHRRSIHRQSPEHGS